MQYIDMHYDTLMKGYLGFKKDIYQSKRNMVDVWRLYEAGVEAQFQHFMKAGGEGCVGIGTDFDGISDHFDVGGPQKMELLFYALQK